jgi:hypothetical protein
MVVVSVLNFLQPLHSTHDFSERISDSPAAERSDRTTTSISSSISKDPGVATGWVSGVGVEPMPQAEDDVLASNWKVSILICYPDKIAHAQLCSTLPD